VHTKRALTLHKMGFFAHRPSCGARHERGHLKYRIIPSSDL
jgi:hypothetical protein